MPDDVEAAVREAINSVPWPDVEWLNLGSVERTRLLQGIAKYHSAVTVAALAQAREAGRREAGEDAKRLMKASLRLTERVRNVLPPLGMGIIPIRETLVTLEILVGEVEAAAEPIYDAARTAMEGGGG